MEEEGGETTRASSSNGLRPHFQDDIDEPNGRASRWAMEC